MIPLSLTSSSRENFMKEEVDKSTVRLSKKQKKFIEIYGGPALCNISATCEKVGISRRNFYYWKERNEKFREAIEDAEEKNIDMAETKLKHAILNDDMTAIIFFLKTKGKKRGYVEQIEQKVEVNPFQQLMMSLPDDV